MQSDRMQLTAFFFVRACIGQVRFFTEVVELIMNELNKNMKCDILTSGISLKVCIFQPYNP